MWFIYQINGYRNITSVVFLREHLLNKCLFALDFWDLIILLLTPKTTGDVNLTRTEMKTN